jgi:hypothetical protein
LLMECWAKLRWNAFSLGAFCLISLLVSGIRLGVPVLLAVLGEVITQCSGILN